MKRFSKFITEKKMTHVIDRKTGESVYGPTDVADAKRYLQKQPQPRKFVIRDIKEDVQLSERFEIQFPTKAIAVKFMRELMAQRLGNSSTGTDGLVTIMTHSGRTGEPTMTHKEIAKIMRKHGGKFVRTDEGPRIAKIFEDVQLDEGYEMRGLGSKGLRNMKVSKKVNAEKIRKILTTAKIPHDMVMGTIRVPERFVRIAREKLDNAFGGMFQKKTGFKISGTLKEDVQIDENVQNQVKRMSRRDKQKLADKLNDLDLSGYGDYEARVDNVHKFKPSDLKMAMQMMSLKEAPNPEFLKVYDSLKKGDKVEVEFDSGIRKGSKITLVVTSGHRVVGKAKVGRIIMKSPDNMRGVSYTLYNRNGSVSLAQGDMGTVMKSIKKK